MSPARFGRFVTTAPQYRRAGRSRLRSVVPSRMFSQVQPLPSQHSLLQGCAISQSAGAVVQCRGPVGIDVDFAVIAHRHT
jgi:hypothetical protein